MKCLTIQLIPELDTSNNEDAIINLAKSISRFPEVDTIDEDDQKIINLNFFTEDIPTLWTELQSVISSNQDVDNWIKNVAVIACEGAEGWDDYLLLAHYDESEKLDTL